MLSHGNSLMEWTKPPTEHTVLNITASNTNPLKPGSQCLDSAIFAQMLLPRTVKLYTKIFKTMY